MKRILVLLLLLPTVAWGQGVTLNQLAPAATLKGSDIFPVWQGANPAKGATIGQIQGLINAPQAGSSFIAGDLVVGGPLSEQVQDSANCSVFCALPKRFQVGSSTSATSLWPDTFIPGTSTASQLYSITTSAQSGYIAGAFNTRTSDTAADTGGVTEGVQILALNDRSTGTRNTWGLYVQGMYTSTTAGTQLFGSELSISNNNPIGTEDPFTVNSQGWAHGLRLDCINAASFGGLTSNSCQNAIDIVNNGKQFSSGIVFGSTALDTSVLTNPPAISLPSSANGYGIYWYSGANAPEWEIFSTGTSGSVKKLQLASTLLQLTDSSGTIDWSLSATTGGQMLVGSSGGANCGNYLQLTGRATGQSVLVQSAGCSDSNVVLDFQSKGTGSVRARPGSNTANAFVVTNAAASTTYLSVDTSAGNVVLPQVTTGTPVASLCIDSSNNIIKKTTTGSCV